MRSLVLLLAFALSGCTCNRDSVNRGDLNLVSLDDEWALGNDLAAEVAAQVAFVEDPVVQAYLDRMGQQLAAQTELADREWTFTVVDDPAVNAFALPGGHVYVNSGLILAAESPDELASVVGHEVAHGVARHATERMVKAYGLQLVAGLVLGDDPGFVREIVAGLVGQGALARFSRKDELEADALGLQFMAGAGYDPDGMPAMFETLLETRARRPLLFERWFQTHPLTEDRIGAAVEAAAALPEPPTPAPAEPAFARVQRRLAAPAPPTS
jgi:predicted Zn-dependent protease